MEIGKAMCLVRMIGPSSYRFWSEWNWSRLDGRVVSVASDYW